MKKTFLSILLIAVAATMLSSCVISIRTHYHKMYFCNDTLFDVDDWYVKNPDGENFAKYTYKSVPVDAGETSSISDLPEDDYQVWWRYTIRDTDIFLHTITFVELDEDTTFKLSKQRFYSARNAASTDMNEEGNFVLETSDGTEIEVVPCTKEEYERNRFN